MASAASPRMARRAARGAVWLAVGLAAAACSLSPRMRYLAKTDYKAFDPEQKVAVYVGQVAEPHVQVALIESDARAYVDDQVKAELLEQLRAKARGMGANALENVRILAKHATGYVPDQQVPFTAWQQGHYDLYFMRATAVRLPEDEPDSLAEAQPKGGWLVDSMKPPSRIESVLNQIPAPTLRNKQ